MSLTKLVKLFETFDENMWSRSKIHIRNIYKVSTNERVLYELFLRNRKNLSTPVLTRLSLFKALFPKGNKSSLNNLTSRLCRVLEDFIINYELKGKEFKWYREMILLKYYKKKGLVDYLLSNSDSLIKYELSQSEYDYGKRLRMHLTAMEIEFSRVDELVRLPYFFKALEDLEIYWKSINVFFLTEISNKKVLFNKEVRGFEERKKNVLIEFLQKMNKLVVNRDDAIFAELKNSYFIISPNMTGMMSETMFDGLVNHCYFRINQGDSNMQFELFELYVKGIDSEILFYNGTLSDSHFLNMVELKSQFYIYKDHSDYINNLSLKIQSKDSQLIRDLAFAYMYFWRDEYETVLDILESIEQRAMKLNIALRIRRMSICCLWVLQPRHMNYMSIIDRHSKFFRRKRNEMSEANYKGSINLIKTIKLFWEDRTIFEIRREIEKYDYLIFRSWINKIIMEHENSI